MANKTNNYKFPKPEADDFYDISEYNKAMDILDDSLTEMDQKKLDKNGDASEAVTEFEQEILRENIESGETLSSTFGKIKKWFTEMKDVAFSGHAKDVTTDAAYRFVSDAEKISWNGKVGASGGDISETNIDSLESINTEFPVPDQGETAKIFMGKVKKFIQDFNNFKSGIITVGKLVNSGSTTLGGYALDARYGKTLFDLYTQLNSDLSERLFFGAGTALQTKAGTTWYRLQINPDDSAGIFKSTNNGITWPIFERFITINDLDQINAYTKISISNWMVLAKKNGLVTARIETVRIGGGIGKNQKVTLLETVPEGWRPLETTYTLCTVRVANDVSNHGTVLFIFESNGLISYISTQDQYESIELNGSNCWFV